MDDEEIVCEFIANINRRPITFLTSGLRLKITRYHLSHWTPAIVFFKNFKMFSYLSRKLSYINKGTTEKSIKQALISLIVVKNWSVDMDILKNSVAVYLL